MPKKKQDNENLETEATNEQATEQEAQAEGAETPELSTQEEITEVKDKLLRTIAEMENLRRRTEKDVEEARKYSVSSFAQDLITVLENLHRAEESVPAEEVEKNELLKNIAEGIKITKNDLLNVFAKHGIERINPQGEKFDHTYHQAVVQIPDEKHEPGTVVQVMQAGYTIKGRLLRPAMVGVAQAPSEASG